MMIYLEYLDNSNSNILSKILLMAQNRYDGTPDSILNITSKMKNTHSKPKSDANIQIVGNIQSKVPFLTVTGSTFEIIESDLDIHTFVFYGSILSPTSPYKIRTTYCIDFYNLNQQTIDTLPDHSYIKSKYYQLTEEMLSDKRTSITISFNTDSFEMKYDEKQYDQPETTTVPYDVFEESTGVITNNRKKITLHATKSSVVKDNFNITLIDRMFYYGP